jgi:hypothetical protein
VAKKTSAWKGKGGEEKPARGGYNDKRSHGPGAEGGDMTAAQTELATLGGGFWGHLVYGDGHASRF